MVPCPVFVAYDVFMEDVSAVILVLEHILTLQTDTNTDDVKLMWEDYLFHTYGVGKAPLSYKIYNDVEFSAEADDPLLQERAHGSSDSVIGEMIKMFAHNDPLYHSDNDLMYSMLEESNSGTIYASTIKPFRKAKDGRAACLTISSSHAGTDKWEQFYIEREYRVDWPQ